VSGCVSVVSSGILLLSLKNIAVIPLSDLSEKPRPPLNVIEKNAMEVAISGSVGQFGTSDEAKSSFEKISHFINHTYDIELVGATGSGPDSANAIAYALAFPEKVRTDGVAKIVGFETYPFVETDNCPDGVTPISLDRASAHLDALAKEYSTLHMLQLKWQGVANHPSHYLNADRDLAQVCCNRIDAIMPTIVESTKEILANPFEERAVPNDIDNQWTRLPEEVPRFAPTIRVSWRTTRRDPSWGDGVLEGGREIDAAPGGRSEIDCAVIAPDFDHRATQR